MKLIAKAPVRISLFGGGTDMHEYSSVYEGVCINMAIDLYQKFQTSDTYKVIGDESFYKSFTSYKVKQTCDVPIRSGLGSSASAAVALLALNKDGLNKQQLAEKAWNIEVNKLGLYGGKQDQYAASYGGMNVFRFTTKDVVIKPIKRNMADKLAEYILLFDTGIVREDAKLQENLKKLTRDRVAALNKVKDMANLAEGYIERGDVSVVAEFLNQAWEAKKQTNSVSNIRIDNIYNHGIKNGAMAGKLLGSGGGGFMIFMVDPEKQYDFIHNMGEIGLTWYDFNIDYNGVSVKTK